MDVNQLNQQAFERLRSGDLAEAEKLSRQVIEQFPDNAPALHCLGIIAQKVGRHPEAASLFTRAIESNPKNADFHYNFSVSLAALRQIDRAIHELREAIRLWPDLAPAHMNLGVFLMGQGQYEEAQHSLQRAAALDPNSPAPHLNLARLLRMRGTLDGAETELRLAITAAPGFASAWNMLGSCLRELGRIPEAIDAFRIAVTREPQSQEAHSNLCYALYYDPSVTPVAILREHRAWAQKFADPITEAAPPHEKSRPADAALRIGYVSADFRGHCQTLFTLPLFSHHDRSNFEIFCYSGAGEGDEFTQRLRGVVDRWRDINAMSDEAAAEQIRNDRIDILVDLTLHMTGNRLPLFARKAAPVQVTWLGYPGTTGLKAIDYRLSDPHLDPPGSGDESYSERTYRLPETFWCYQSFSDQPSVSDLPARRNGVITFGCLNSFAKVSQPTLELWAAVLASVKGSRLLARVPRGNSRKRVADFLSSRGIQLDRIGFAERQPHMQYLQLYQHIDISLDTLPYPGHTTSIDSLWMGVPVITLAGQTAVSRGGASILSNAGLPDLVATSPEHYVRIAAKLAADPVRLGQLRASLRARLESSPLMDASRFTRSIEAAYRTMWNTWRR